MATQLKTVNIKGKDYVEVNERLKYFRQNFKDYSLESEVISLDKESITIKAIIKDENGRIIATGLAQEDKASSFINKTSYVENCETSAWGRALGNLGIGIDTSVASCEEVANAILNQNKEEKPLSKVDKIDKAIIDQMLSIDNIEQLVQFKDNVKDKIKDLKTFKAEYLKHYKAICG